MKKNNWPFGIVLLSYSTKSMLKDHLICFCLMIDMQLFMVVGNNSIYTELTRAIEMLTKTCYKTQQQRMKVDLLLRVH